MNTLARFPKQLSDAVRRRRKELGITQADLGRKAGISQKVVSNVEAGAPGTRLQTLMDILTALDMELVFRSRVRDNKKIEDIF